MDDKMSWKKLLLPVQVFAKIGIRRSLRNKTAIFFMFLFPLIFLFIFGGLFGKSKASFHVALINQSSTAFAKQFVKQTESSTYLKVEEDPSLAAVTDKLNRGQLDAAIVLPSDFGAVKGEHPAGQAQVYFTQN